MIAAGVGGAEIALSFTDDREILALNRNYAGEDHATDVLSFSQIEGESPPGTASAKLLGDVVISIETARRQAQAGGRTLGQELFHLAVHGLVHLLGYDHATPRQEKQMFGYEAELRACATSVGPVRSCPRPKPVRARRV